MSALATLIPLCRRRWSIPALAHLSRRSGDRFVPLAHALSANHEALRDTLHDLTQMGLVGPNPGYGHPLRPEYILTARGRRLAPACERLDGLIQTFKLREVCLRRWSLPALYVIGQGAARFTDIGRGLGEVTDRALSLSLTSLDEASVVVRRLMEQRPPRFDYSLAETGHEIHRAVADL